jgi:hypothetical protein
MREREKTCPYFGTTGSKLNKSEQKNQTCRDNHMGVFTQEQTFFCTNHHAIRIDHRAKRYFILKTKLVLKYLILDRFIRFHIKVHKFSSIGPKIPQKMLLT